MRAAALVEHLEFDFCPKISAQQFRSNIQHKYMVTKILNNPEGLNSKLFDFDVTDTDSAGGISLVDSASTILDADDPNTPAAGGGSAMKPLVPEVKPQNPSAPRVGERWPTLPGHKDSSATDLSSSMARISLGGSSSGGAPLPHSGTPSAATRTPSTRTRSRPSSVSTDTTAKDESTAASKPWGGSSTSKVLFQGAQKTPLTNQWEKALQAKNEQYERENSNNLLWMRYWDPTHKDYDPERFYNPVIEMYLCPLPQCEESFPEPFMLEHHINTIHAISQVRCPQCLKLFKSTTALVAHCEAPTSQCGISRSDRYGQAIDQFSGGFLGATDARRPDFTDQERKDKIGDDLKLMPGSGFRVGYTKYESTLPADWNTNSFHEDVQIGRTWDQGGAGPNRRGGAVNPSVPLSRSMKQLHSTRSIYPEPFQDYIPEITPQMFAPSREERNKRQAQQQQAASSVPDQASKSSENATPAPTPGQRKKKVTQRRVDVTAQLVDPKYYQAARKGQHELAIQPEPERMMRRDEAKYLSHKKAGAASDTDSVSGSSVSGRRSAWM